MVVGINLPRVDLFLIVIARERLERPRDKTRAQTDRLALYPRETEQEKSKKRERDL